ncbi:MAG: NAD-dependent epimerase/dehydratase family protein [Alphaproteobacteria bacterium]
MTILITGAGLIGCETARLLQARGERVVLFDINPRRADIDRLIGPGKAAIVQGDIADLDALLATIDAHKVDRVVHTAAMLTGAILRDPARGLNVNIMGTVNVLEAARRRGVKRVVASSSTTISYPAFSTFKGDRFPVDFEAHVLSQKPTSFYAVCKLACEHLTMQFHQDFGLDTVLLRYGAVLSEWAGPNTSIGGRMMRVLLEAAIQGRTAVMDDPMLLWNGGDDFIDARDCASANVAALFAADPKQRAYFVTMGKMHTLDDVIASVRKSFPGFKVDIRATTKGSFANFPYVRPATSDISANERELGWRPQYDLDATVAAAAQAMREKIAAGN